MHESGDIPDAIWSKFNHPRVYQRLLTELLTQTRVINIKTEYPRNILVSLRSGKYSVMEKVAERIMKVWDAREKASEKVLFLFSVNGSKKYCGVAEMSAPWEREDKIQDWEENPASNPCVGYVHFRRCPENFS